MLGEVPSVITKPASTRGSSDARATARSKPSLRLLIIVLVIVVALALGSVLHSSSSSSVRYGCVSINRQGSDLDVTTTGVIHISGTEYYMSCSEGSSLPTTSLSVSCLTVTPHVKTSSSPGASGTYYYYLSTKTGTMTLQGAPSNATEIVEPTTASILVEC